MSEILCIVDGMTDPFFTPSDYPHLSAMTLTHYTDTCLGCKPESLGCILHLLGVAHVPDYLRGYAEALGAGIPVGPQDLILRGSWFGLDKNGNCTLPIAGPQQPDTPDGCRYYSLGQYRSLLIFSGVASQVQNLITYAPYECAGHPAASLCPKGCAVVENAYRTWLTRQRCLIPWGQSVPADLPPFPRRSAVISGTTVVNGIARLLKMEQIHVSSATGEIDTDLVAKTTAALKAAETFPFVVLHINGADEAGHRKNYPQKKAFLRQVDRQVLAPLLRSGHFIRVVSDHGTDPSTGTHIGIPQPVFAYGREPKNKN